MVALIGRLKVETHTNRTLDIRGVSCPMNYVKILVALSELKSAERLEVILNDDRALADVPRSAKEDGHKVVKISPEGNAWRLIIEKGGSGG